MPPAKPLPKAVQEDKIFIPPPRVPENEPSDDMIVQFIQKFKFTKMTKCMNLIFIFLYIKMY